MLRVMLIFIKIMKFNRMFFTAVVGISMLAGCSKQPKITVINHSGVLLSNLVASGSGFSQSLGTLAAGAQVRASVNPTGESSLGLEFDANGKHFSSPPDGYFENSNYYQITATVEPDFSVIVDARTTAY